jgi:hypothetical protein
MGHANTPPQIPEVTDEAGDSPKWLPMLGVAVLAALVAWAVLSHSGAAGEEDVPAAEGEPAAE